MKKILITGTGNIFNNGEFAMLLGVYEGISNNFCDFELNVLTNKKEECKKIIKNKKINFLNDYWVGQKKNKLVFIRSVIWNIVFLVFSRFVKMKSKHESLNAYNDCDIIVDLSGDGISTDYTVLSLYLRLYSLFCGMIAKKKIILLGQTIGPIKGRINLFLTRFILSKANVIVLREERSFDYMIRHKFLRKNLVLGTDNALLLEPDIEGAENVLFKNVILPNSKLIGLSPSAIVYKWFPDNASNADMKKEYIRSVAGVIDILIENYKFKVLLIPHVISSVDNDDLEVCKEIYKAVKNKNDITLLPEYYNGAILKGIIARLHFLITFRMHAAVAAISSGVPVICWSYNDKFEGLIGDKMGLSQYIVNIRENNLSEVMKKTLILVEQVENDYQNITYSLKKNAATQKGRALENISHIFENMGIFK
ncbi:MAG: polysaccharide pyruvyl transferase family protein [Candidatus Omnitrophica bacterium]|nr:polysaccharide pyruvyl transferase family protein [Candidatus Omnitrophota bacterium]